MHKAKCQLTLELAKEKSTEAFTDKNEKLNPETKNIVTIFGSVLIWICFTFFFGIVILHYSINNNDDVYNWTLLIIGLDIGIIWTVWTLKT